MSYRTASIVINTFSRARALERLLPSLARLEGVYEVVVVNGPSTDDTETVVASWADRLKIERCAEANLSRSRNVGIAAAAGEVVVFIDDDALPGDAAWLTRLLAAFDDPQVGAAGGPSLHRDGDWPEFAGGWTSDYGEQQFGAAPTPAGEGWARRTVGNNSAFRRSALVAIGGFDEHFPYYLDEADVCLRLTRAGYAVAYVPEAPVRHYPAPSPLGPPFIRNRRLIARSDTYYALKNGRHGRWRRLWRTLRLAPRKHFVTEVAGLVADGRLTPAQARRIRWQWLRGVAQGLWLGLTAPRGTRPLDAEPPPFVAFATAPPAPRRAIALVARRLPPDPQAGGVGRYTADLARGLFELGHDVTLITESETPLARLGLGFEVVGVRPAATAPRWSQTPVLAANLAYAAAVADVVRARQAGPSPFDVVHATNWGLEGYGVAAWGGCPLTLMLVTPLESVMAAERWDASVDLSANLRLDQWTIDAADRVCAPTARVVETYARRDDWSGAAVHPVALGTVPAPVSARPSGRQRRLLFVGRLERRKGIHLLLEALPALLPLHPDWTCELVGNDTVPAEPGVTFKAQFLARHADAPWLSRVEFAGAVSDAELQQRYARADVFVAPSLFESFGLIYLEALQHGVPVVGAAVGGVPDVVRDGVDGLLVPPGDAPALAAALDRLMSDKALRTRLGTAAREALTQRTHHAMAARLLREYDAAIAAHAASYRAGETTALDQHALTRLEQWPDTRGLSLASQAAEAFADGRRDAAARLVAEALGLGARPDHYALALELALDRSGDDAVALAAEGFAATADLSDACLACAAVLLTSPGGARPAGWETWRRTHDAVLGERLLAAATTAVRSSRDRTAAHLLRACHVHAERSPRLRAQAAFHLGSALKRLGQAAEARTWLEVAAAPDAVALLEPPYRAAIQFHLGDLALTAGDDARAVIHLDACLVLAPGHARARARRADVRPAPAAA